MRIRTNARRVPARPSPRRPGAGALVLALAAALVLGPSAAAPASPRTPPVPGAGAAAGPEGLASYPLAALGSLLRPDAAPPGADDFSCRPTAAYPRPVVLLHGTYANAFAAWNRLAPLLKVDGYCVFALNYGGKKGSAAKGGARIADSSKELAAYVDRVLAATGARQVDLVGHSQGGGPLPRWYLKFDGGADASDPAQNKVRRLIGLAPSNHGATLFGLTSVVGQLGALGLVGSVTGPAVADQLRGSAFHAALDRGGDTVPGVEYTVISTRGDALMDGARHQYLQAGPGATVDNITIQERCGLDLSAHFDVPYDSNILTLARNALDPAHPRPFLCTLVLPALIG
ncbi:alpha/beta fold hydrolase [Streptomyces sp. NPDC001941]|uniref:esterase/lipase family protein n=1 Tax=Streptomyces sp. NPDC001941 TaxID=3154659 RepID=UPI0033243235